MEYSDEKDQLLQDQIDDALETQAEIQVVALILLKTKLML